MGSDGMGVLVPYAGVALLLCSSKCSSFVPVSGLGAALRLGSPGDNSIVPLVGWGVALEPLATAGVDCMVCD